MTGMTGNLLDVYLGTQCLCYFLHIIFELCINFKAAFSAALTYVQCSQVGINILSVLQLLKITTVMELGLYATIVETKLSPFLQMLYFRYGQWKGPKSLYLTHKSGIMTLVKSE